jgi:hypothetical protein
MMVIRREQWEVLQDGVEQRFAAVLLEELARMHPQNPRERIAAEIPGAMHQALRFGITLGIDIAEFVSLRLMHAEKLDLLLADPGVREMLARKELSGARKVGQLEALALRPLEAVPLRRAQDQS